jgi:hypothetical protein
MNGERGRTTHLLINGEFVCVGSIYTSFVIHGRLQLVLGGEFPVRSKGQVHTQYDYDSETNNGKICLDGQINLRFASGFTHDKSKDLESG